MSLSAMFEEIMSDGWDAKTGSVSDFTPTPDGEYTGEITEIKYSEHDNGFSVRVSIEDEDANKASHMMYVSNTLEQDWEKQGASKTIKSLAKLGDMIGLELEPEDFDDIEELVEKLEDVLGESVTIKLETRYNKKKKKDQQNSELIFEEVLYIDEDSEIEDEEEEEEEEEEVKVEPKKKPKKKAKVKPEPEPDPEEEEEEEEEVEDEEITEEDLKGMKISELRKLATEFGVDDVGNLKKIQLIDAIMAEA